MNDVWNWTGFFVWAGLTTVFLAIYLRRKRLGEEETKYVGWAAWLAFLAGSHGVGELTNSVSDAALGLALLYVSVGVFWTMFWGIDRVKAWYRRRKEAAHKLDLDLPRVSVILVTDSMASVEFMNRMYSVQQQTYPADCVDSLIIMAVDGESGEQVWTPEDGARWGVERATTDLVAVVSPGEQWPPSMLARLVGFYREEDSGDSVTLEGFMAKDFGAAGVDPHQKVKATLCTRDYYLEHVS